MYTNISINKRMLSLYNVHTIPHIDFPFFPHIFQPLTNEHVKAINSKLERNDQVPLYSIDGEYTIVQLVCNGGYYAARQVICRCLCCSGVQGGDAEGGGERQGGRREGGPQPQVGVIGIGLSSDY